MDMQGTPIGGTNQGTKNTTDPRAKNPINESTGPVASDSLAAESYQAGGGFSENKDAAPSSTSGSSSTWNTTDTSGAQKLDAAPDAESRRSGGDDTGNTKYPDTAGGQPSFPGDHNVGQGYIGGQSGSTAGSISTGSSNSGLTRATGGYSASGADTYDSSNADSAPSYTLSQQGAFNQGKPKGANLTEGGFDGEPSNHAADVGTDDDPGRAAVQGFANASAATEPAGQLQMGKPGGDQQPFGALGGDPSA